MLGLISFLFLSILYISLFSFFFLFCFLRKDFSFFGFKPPLGLKAHSEALNPEEPQGGGPPLGYSLAWGGGTPLPWGSEARRAPEGGQKHFLVL